MRPSSAWACGPPASRLPPSSFCKPSAAIRSLVAVSRPEAMRPTSIWHHGAGPSTMSNRLRSTVGPTRICRLGRSSGMSLGGSTQAVVSLVGRAAGRGVDRHAVGQQRHRLPRTTSLLLAGRDGQLEDGRRLDRGIRPPCRPWAARAGRASALNTSSCMPLAVTSIVFFSSTRAAADGRLERDFDRALVDRVVVDRRRALRPRRRR